jgi:hypothetical protein
MENEKMRTLLFGATSNSYIPTMVQSASFLIMNFYNYMLSEQYAM